MVFFYAFLAVLCLGVAPLFGKPALYHVDPITALVIRTFVAATLVGVWLVTMQPAVNLTDLSFSNWLLITAEAALAAVLGELAYFYALAKGDVYEIAVLMACTPLVTVTLGYLFFGLPLTLKQLIGVLIVTTGLIMLCGD